jgi:exodeoxyribonuclease X
MKLIVLDTETSDLDPAKGAEVLELAWAEVEPTNEGWKPTLTKEFYLHFTGEVSPQAQAVHHIPPHKFMIEHGALPRIEAYQYLYDRIEPDTLMVAHNAPFDSKFFPLITRPWICTLKSARHIWPSAAGYSNQVLRYWLEVDIYKIFPEVQNRHPHQALYDVATTTSILLRMLETHTPEQLLRLCQQPVRLKTIGFGKHKGQEFKNIPMDYLIWLRSNTQDEDVKHTIDSLGKS